MNKKLFIILLCVIFVIPFYYIVNNNIFYFVLGSSLFLILNAILSNISIYEVINDFYNKKYFYSNSKVYIYTTIVIVIISLLLSIMMYFLGILSNYLLNIKHLEVIYLFSSLCSLSIPILRINKEYLKVYGYKKLSNSIYVIYTIINILYILVASYLTGHILKNPNYLDMSILLLSHVFSLIIIIIFLYFGIYIHRKKSDKTREENKINYKLIIKKVINRNVEGTIKMVVKCSFFYLSIILIYRAFTNNYMRSSTVTTEVINNTYFYTFSIIVLIISIAFNYLKPFINKVKEDIVKKDIEMLSDDIINLNQLILKKFLPVVITLIILSEPIYYLIFNNHNYQTLSLLLLAVIFIILGLVNLMIVESFSSKKNVLLFLVITVIVKLVLTIPMLESFYLMGSDLIFGEIMASIISMITLFTLCTFKIRETFKISLTKNFEKNLEIIYDNIILTLILVLMQFILPIKIDGKLESIYIIIVYSFLSYIVLLGNIKKKKFKRIRSS